MTNRRHVAVPARTDRFSWNNRNGTTGSFEPNGTMYREGEDDLSPNKRDWETDSKMYAARIFVGFNVDDQPRWTMDDLVPIVKRIRSKQVGSPDSSFLYQRGVYAHQKRGHEVVADEESAQIIILNLPHFDTAPAAFEQQMVDLATSIADELHQESVIIEIQKAGQTERTISVVPG